MASGKTVFGKETFQFFRELAKNNHKPWMDENRERYKSVIVQPFRKLLEDLAPAIASKVAPGGRLVLSGLLSEQAAAAERAYVAEGLSPLARSDREGWVRLELSRDGSGAG